MCAFIALCLSMLLPRDLGIEVHLSKFTGYVPDGRWMIVLFIMKNGFSSEIYTSGFLWDYISTIPEDKIYQPNAIIFYVK